MSDKMREAFEENIPFGFSAKNSDGEYIDHETSVWFDEFSRGWEAALSQQPESEPHEREIQKLLERRDELATICDQLAARVAELTGVDIGEHSSANCPWTNALEAPDKPITDPLNEQPESEPVGYISKEYLDALAGETKHLCSTISAEPRHNSSIDYVIPVFTSHRPSAQVPEGWPTDEMVVRGGESLFDSLREHNVAFDGSTRVDQEIAESVFNSMLTAAPSIAEKDQ